MWEYWDHEVGSSFNSLLTLTPFSILPTVHRHSSLYACLVGVAALSSSVHCALDCLPLMPLPSVCLLGRDGNRGPWQRWLNKWKPDGHVMVTECKIEIICPSIDIEVASCKLRPLLLERGQNTEGWRRMPWGAMSGAPGKKAEPLPRVHRVPWIVLGCEHASCVKHLHCVYKTCLLDVGCQNMATEPSLVKGLLSAVRSVFPGSAYGLCLAFLLSQI